jgi:hypothetical protein
MPEQPMNIQVHIERLILDGVAVAPGERSRLQAAVEGELARRLAEGGLAPALLGGGAVPAVQAGNIQLAGEPDTVGLGQQIARAAYGGIGR